MQTSNPPSGLPARVRLSSRGHSTEAAYRSHLTAKGPVQRKALHSAQSEWALSHGLEPSDGVYLGELRIAALTLEELGEALAICGQTQTMVSETVDRLVERGFLEQLRPSGSQKAGPSFERVRQELATAELELDAISCEFEADHDMDRRMIGASLRQAVSRVMVARRFLESLTSPH